jgi:hypothetical protein
LAASSGIESELFILENFPKLWLKEERIEVTALPAATAPPEATATPNSSSFTGSNNSCTSAFELQIF